MIPELDIEAYRAWIGREENGGDIVTSELVKRFRADLDASTPVVSGEGVVTLTWQKGSSGAGLGIGPPFGSAWCRRCG